MIQFTSHLAVVLALGAGALTTSHDDHDTTLPVLAVTTVESSSGETTYEFDMPDEVPAGATRITLANEGDEPHHVQLFQLDDGATMTDLADALSTGDPSAMAELGSFVGGTGVVDPGEVSHADAIVDLEAGTYAVICFVPDAEGTPHLAHGMLRSLDVTDETGESGESGEPAAPPDADAEVTLVDFAFDTPGTLPGDAVVAVTNDESSSEPHELLVGRLDDGAAVDDVIAALAEGSPPPMTAVGGMQALAPGADALLRLDLEPGQYVFICQIPSADDHAHYTKGMIAEVTIT
jgi:uncharacterized cupredoxin-like copper-binding protein